MTFSMADWSDPGTSVVTGVDVVAFYVGGATPHVWTSTQVAAQTVSLMVPIWVYSPSRPGAANGTAEGDAAVAAARALGVPTGVRIVLDMETSVDQAYCSAFRNAVAAAGYWTTIYGSASTVFGNSSLLAGFGGGWWVADWTGTPHLYGHAGVWATQWSPNTQTIPWDRSEVSTLSNLWPHRGSVSYTLTAKASDSASTASRTAGFTVS